MTLDKKTFETRCDETLKDLKQKIGQLRLELKLGTMEAREKKKEILSDLDRRFETAREELSRVREARESDWERIRGKAELAWKDVSEGFKKAAAQFHKQDEAGK